MSQAKVVVLDDEDAVAISVADALAARLALPGIHHAVLTGGGVGTKVLAELLERSAAIDWTKRAFSAGAEGAKDGAALVAAETLTAGVIAAISVEAPIVLTIYNNSALAQKLLQVLVPYSLGLAATMGWLPQSEMVAQLAERALRASISGNIGPLFARFKLPIMRVVESAMRDTADADRFSSLGRSNGS